MKEPEEDQEASVKMHSTDIPPCKGVEGEIPLVECALMCSEGSSERRDTCETALHMCTGRGDESQRHSKHSHSVKELVLLLGVKARLGCKIAELPSL